MKKVGKGHTIASRNKLCGTVDVDFFFKIILGIIPKSGDNHFCNFQESFAPSENRNMANPAEDFMRLPQAAAFQARAGGNGLLNLLAQQEPRAGDTGDSLSIYLINGF